VRDTALGLEGVREGMQNAEQGVLLFADVLDPGGITHLSTGLSEARTTPCVIFFPSSESWKDSTSHRRLNQLFQNSPPCSSRVHDDPHRFMVSSFLVCLIYLLNSRRAPIRKSIDHIIGKATCAEAEPLIVEPGGAEDILEHGEVLEGELGGRNPTGWFHANHFS